MCAGPDADSLLMMLYCEQLLAIHSENRGGLFVISSHQLSFHRSTLIPSLKSTK